MLFLSVNFVSRLGSVSFIALYRASRQGTSLSVTLEETLVACHRRQPTEYRTKSQENFVGHLVSLA